MGRLRMFEPGTPVTVKRRYPPGHVRTPYYLRGKRGIVERAIRPFKNPEQLAYGVAAEDKFLYRVRFEMGELWSNAERASDTVDVEIYEHWLEEA